MAFCDRNPYAHLMRLAEGTACQLNSDDVRALQRLSAWMEAYAVQRRSGAVPPSDGASLTSAYFMVSFFQQLARKRLPSKKWNDVNALFEEICVNSSDDVINRFERAPATPEKKHGPDAPTSGMLPGYAVEAVLSGGEVRVPRFWNPLDVPDLAWCDLLKKLSAIGAYEAAASCGSKRRRKTS